MDITDDFMRDMLTKAKPYTMVFLKATDQMSEPNARAIVWEHGRRNFSLRADGVLAVVCPITDDSGWSGIGIFDASTDDVIRIMEDDPGVRAGIFTYEVHPVRSFPGDSLPA